MNQKHKKKLSPGLIAVIVVLAVALAGVCAYFIKQNMEEKARVAAREAQVETAVTSVAGGMNIDMTFVSHVFNGARFETNLESEAFHGLTDEEKLAYFVGLDNYQTEDFSFRNSASYVTIRSQGVRYTASVSQFYDGDYAYTLYVDGEEVLRQQDITVNSGGSGEKCSRCNGTGSVKYYYGGSAVEAIMDGYADSWYGQCGSCGGTGRQ